MWGIKWNNHRTKRSGILTGCGHDNFKTKKEAENYLEKNPHYLGNGEQWFSIVQLELRGLSQEGRQSRIRKYLEYGNEHEIKEYYVEADYTTEIIEVEEKVDVSDHEKLTALWELVVNGKTDKTNELKAKLGA